jgi:hypothetical protein
MSAVTTTGNIYMWGVDSGATFAGTGLTSGQSFTPTATDNGGQKITLGTGGTLTVTLDSSSPSYTIATAGSTGVPLSSLKFHAATEAITLQKVSLVLTNTASSSVTDMTQVTLWADGVQVGTTVFTTGAYATSTLTTPVLISKDGDKVITIKGDLSAIGTSLLGTEGALIAVDYNVSDLAGTKGIGANSGTTIESTSASITASNGVRMFKSYPTFAKIAVPSTILVTGTMDIYRFSIAANPSTGNGIGLHQLTVNIATSTASSVSGTTTFTAMKVYAYTDSAFATPVSGYTNGLIVAEVAGLVSSGNNDAQLSSILQIPAGLTYYFKVTGTVTLTAGSGTFSGSITTKINGDTAYPSLATLMGAQASVDGNANGDNLVWSPNATTTSSATHIDWTNGYYVSGLPSDGMDSVTISK